MTTVVIIPSFNPTPVLVELVTGLLQSDPSLQVIVVNDGSDADHQSLFKEVPKSVVVLHHMVNLGKGQALKTALNYVLLNFKPPGRIVTADSDGQHQLEDILKVVGTKTKSDDGVILGVRELRVESTPLRSLIGNRLMSHILFFLGGIRISDTQTGLRAFSFHLAKEFLRLRGRRYEFEVEMLMFCRQNNIPLYPVSINTIYIAGNQSSHFHPVMDSARILWKVLRFALLRKKLPLSKNREGGSIEF